MTKFITIFTLLILTSCENLIVETETPPVKACPGIFKYTMLTLRLNLNHSPKTNFEITLNGEVFPFDQICSVFASSCLESQSVSGNSRMVKIRFSKDHASYDLSYSEEGSELIRKYSLTATPTDKYSECFGHKEFELSVAE